MEWIFPPNYTEAIQRNFFFLIAALDSYKTSNNYVK